MSAMKDTLIRTIEDGHELFVSRYAELTARANAYFRDFKPEPKEEAVQNALVLTWEDFAALIERALANDTLLTSTFYFACKRTRSGRNAGRITSSGYKELFNHAKPHNAIDMDSFISARTDVFTHVCFKIDTEAWLDSLSESHRTRAIDLASGEAPSDLATRWKISRAAVSGEKRYLESNYASFIGECA